MADDAPREPEGKPKDARDEPRETIPDTRSPELLRKKERLVPLEPRGAPAPATPDRNKVSALVRMPPPKTDDEAVIVVKDLTAGYGDQVVLRDVNLTVRRGEIMVILGGSGCGKSTLLKLMLGLEKPMSGSIEVLGVDVANASEREMEELYKKLGIVYQAGALYNSLTVAENVALPLVEHTTLDEKIIDISVRMKLGLVNLSGFEDRLPSALSGGQVKRVAFARAIAMDPQVLFCDEPSAGLDPRIARGLDDLIRNLNAAFKMAIVVVTHHMESVQIIADRITMLAPQPGGARVVFQGTYDELVHSEEPVVRDFVARAPLSEPRTEAREVLRALVGQGDGKKSTGPAGSATAVAAAGGAPAEGRKASDAPPPR
jgi:phospholipid/cholesterol/gamma-HCH transport system ATP-binding protein